jgi:alcohol dehydrogenase
MALIQLGDVTYRFVAPSLSLMGPGCSKEVGAEVKKLGATHVLLVTDKGIAKLGMIDQIKEHLEKAGLKVTAFDGVEPDPSDKNVHAGAEIYQQSGCDALVSLGGGSSHDCAKGIGVVVTSGGDIREYAGIDRLKKRLPPFVAINTTAGTGSEATRTAVITNSDNHIKMPVVDARCLPVVAINDPRLMIAMPPALTAATGMDALSHAVETYVSLSSTLLSDACAIQAIKLISRWLRPAVANGTNLEARDKMAYAAFLAGLAFTNGRVGCAHAIAHQLGRYGIPHGVLCAVLLPYVCEYNMIAAPERFAEIAAAMGEKVEGFTVMEAATKAPTAIRNLNKDIGIASNLAELGVKEADLEVLAQSAMNDLCRTTNPRQPVTFEDMLFMIRRAMGPGLVKAAGA